MIEASLGAAADTEALGAALARTAPASSNSALTVFLCGELGAGKTTLARGLLRALGVVGIVRSPSYTLLEPYETGGRRVLHLDLYRLAAAEELAALGLRDELAPGVVLLVEWPERAREALPPPDLEVQLAMDGEGRRAALASATPEGAAWLSRIKTNLAR
jgi:tRNA threonylcarbamoyladenosine biosynthesis protein TsaE